MKRVFFFTFVVLVVLTIVAWEIRPRLEENGRTVLTWVSDDNPVREGQINLFNRTHPHLLLKLDPTNGGMEKVIVQSLADVGPDLFDCYDGFQLSAFVRSGIAWDVTDELAKDGIHPGADTWDCLHPIFMQDGRVFGFADNTAANALYFNKAIFDRAHVPYPHGPWTWRQFLPLAEKLTTRDANGRVQQFGFVCDWDNNWLQFVEQWGGRLYSPDGTQCVIDSPQAVAGVQFMHDLIYKYHVMPTPVEESMATQGGWGSFAIMATGAGKAAMALGGRWWLCTLRDPSNYQNLRLGVAESPYGLYRVFRGYGRATLINRASPRRRQALKFLEYLASRDFNALVNHQADGLGPVKRFAWSGSYMHDPEYPNETYNAVWRDELSMALPDQVSPFVNGQAASRTLTQQMDLIKNDQKPVAEALADAARAINQQIQDNVNHDPVLRARYLQVLAKRKHQTVTKSPQNPHSRPSA